MSSKLVFEDDRGSYPDIVVTVGSGVVCIDQAGLGGFDFTIDELRQIVVWSELEELA